MYINGAVNEIKAFSAISGLKINIDKTKCLPIGTSDTGRTSNEHGIKYVNELKILGVVGI